MCEVSSELKRAHEGGKPEGEQQEQRGWGNGMVNPTEGKANPTEGAELHWPWGKDLSRSTQ